MREWNDAIDYIDAHLGGEIDGAELASITMTSEFHFRRMFATLAGMPLSEYVRRRRLTRATGDILAGRGVLDVALAYGYGSAESFTRAFKAFNRLTPSQARAPGARLHSQPQLRFHLRVEGSSQVEYRIQHTEPFTLAGYRTRVPLVHSGPNRSIEDFEKALDKDAIARLHSLSTTAPAGPLAVTCNIDDPGEEGSMLDYWHAVATTAEVPAEFDMLSVSNEMWVVFGASGQFPEALQQLWATAATEWFPANPYLWAPGPQMLSVEYTGPNSGTGELWLPIEPAPTANG